MQMSRRLPTVYPEVSNFLLKMLFLSILIIVAGFFLGVAADDKIVPKTTECDAGMYII